ncbi:hypothetical protein [Salinimicrobium terrae]|uniref:hypothetical protein n=1 Tax=Salinimicrobium terrae TaxID=470866 RepID=UPI000417005E|nr:hypothetical protein [Salinimicrobium terrae]
MEKTKLNQSINWLENLLEDFKEAKARGKETNSNQVRAESISDIEEITQRLENYIRSNEELLEQITGTEIELARKISWNDVVRPSHFEEDLRKEIINLKKKAPS